MTSEAYPFSSAARDPLDLMPIHDVVLVSPHNPLNMGAAARAMVNFGFARQAVANALPLGGGNYPTSSKEWMTACPCASW